MRTLCVASLFALFIASACSPSKEDSGPAYTVELVSVEAEGSAAKVTVKTEPGAWIKLLDRKREAQGMAEPTRGNADDKGMFTFKLLRPKPKDNTITVVAHEAADERGREVLTFDAPEPEPVEKETVHTFSLRSSLARDDEAKSPSQCRGGRLEAEGDAKVRGSLKCQMLDVVKGGTLPLKVSGPPGATLTIADAKLTLPDEGKGALEVDARSVDGLGDAKLGDMRKSTQFPLALPVTATLASGETLTGSLSLPGSAAGDLFRGLSQPVTFGEDDVADDETRILYVQYGGTSPWSIPSGLGTLRDIDWIAIGEIESKVLEVCKYGTRDNIREKPRRRDNLKVTVYDRRAGKLVEEKLFKAPKPRKCSDVVEARQAKIPLYTRVEDKEVRTWLETLL